MGGGGESLYPNLNILYLKKSSDKCSPPASTPQVARKASTTAFESYGPDRPTFLGPFTEPPSYLKGEYAGDYGWDSAGLSSDPETFARYREVEVMHGRWALLGALGMITPEEHIRHGVDFFGSAGAVWYKAQAQILAPEGINYLGTHNSLPGVTTWFMLAVMGQAEAFRQGGEAPGLEGLDSLYPGGPFDPLNLGSDPETLAELKTKEVKHGRMAMVACAGLFVQAIVTKESPMANLDAHLADPQGANVFKYAAGWA